MPYLRLGHVTEKGDLVFSPIKWAGEMKPTLQAEMKGLHG